MITIVYTSSNFLQVLNYHNSTPLVVPTLDKIPHNVFDIILKRAIFDYMLHHPNCMYTCIHHRL